jgi:cellulose biosynthesis protein BcsQ
MSEKIGKLHVVINTKGGVGKTTTSTIVASYLYEKSNKESKIKILEVDDNNNSGAAYCDSEIASFETFNVNVGVDKMQESLFETSEGLVKVEKLANTKKINQYSYLLTEKGIKEKITLTEKFIEKKKKEYDQLQADLERYKQMDEYKKIFEGN